MKEEGACSLFSTLVHKSHPVIVCRMFIFREITDIFRSSAWLQCHSQSDTSASTADIELKDWEVIVADLGFFNC